MTLAPTPWLDGKHTIFGRVYSGMDTVKRLGVPETESISTVNGTASCTTVRIAAST